MGMTAAEKILASASGRSAVKAGEHVTAAIGVARLRSRERSAKGCEMLSAEILDLLGRA